MAPSYIIVDVLAHKHVTLTKTPVFLKLIIVPLLNALLSIDLIADSFRGHS